MCKYYLNAAQVHTFTDYLLEELLLLAKGSERYILPRCAMVQVQRVLLTGTLHLQPGAPVPAPHPNLVSLTPQIFHYFCNYVIKTLPLSFFNLLQSST